MELKLNVYKNKEIVKTYTANDFMLMTGVCEDIINMIDIDKMLDGKLTEQQLGVEIVKIVAKSFSKFRPLLQDVFVGLTDDEYRCTPIKDVANVVIKIVKHTVNELFNVGGNSKN